MPLSVRILGDRLQAARQKRGLTQEQVAERMNLDASHVSKIERGAKNLTVVRLADYCDVLNIPIEAILSEANTPANEEFNRQFGAIAKGCSPETVRAMLEVCSKIAEVEARAQE
ncbi:MAG: helix-turn-helix transcriptional regulator [Christensenellaceae bacterium]|nr:helix-turn-helix transcriptional regulator [Christensenellaceae bacterium]